MAKAVIKPGAVIDLATPEEIAELLQPRIQVSRIRVPSNIQLDANGHGQDEVYVVPAGMKFEVRRVVLTLTGNIPSDPNTGNVALNVAGKFVAYLRSGSLIEYGQPQYGAAIQVPGVQTWGSEQGPQLSNKEAFEIYASGLTASVVLNAYVEGILTGPLSA